MAKSFSLKNMLIIFIFFFIVCNGLVTIFAEKTSLENEGTPLESIFVKGVVDRIENGELAVILVEELGLELIVETNDFDAKLSEDIWVDLVLVGKEINELSIDWEKTKGEKMRVKELLKKLKEDDY